MREDHVIISPQVALVSWTETVGLSLVRRDLHSMTLCTPQNKFIKFTILQIFPFTSETKRMGIIVKVSAQRSLTCMTTRAERSFL